MGNLLNLRTKEFLMITVNLSSLLLSLSCKNMEKQYYEVVGKEELLKKSKICLLKVDEKGNENIQTILCNGKLNKIEVENEIASINRFFISYNDSQIEILSMENIFRNASDQINHLILEEKDNEILIKFVGRRADLDADKGFQKKLTAKDEFYKIHNIQSEEEIKKNNMLFFQCQ